MEILSERHIKARFRRSHLLKVCEDMLTDAVEVTNSKGKKEILNAFTLKKGITVEQVVDSIKFNGEVVDNDKAGKHWKGYAANVAINGKVKTCQMLKVYQADDRRNRGFMFYADKDRMDAISDNVDKWIKRAIMAQPEYFTVVGE